MFKRLWVPERLFSIAMWAVSLVFAGFLIGLGGKVVGELPGVDQAVTIEQYMDGARLQPIRTQRQLLREEQSRIDNLRSTLSLQLDSNRTTYSARKEAYDNWRSTRTATSDPDQDPDGIARMRVLDTLLESQARAQKAIEVQDARRLQVSQGIDSLDTQQSLLRDEAVAPYQRALFQSELTVFGIRLALTLPLLLLGIWLIAKKRKSDYWPLARGFVLFALFAFFVELVPYLPSYGGYVRYIVGILLTLVAGHYVIRAMQAYVAKRQVVEMQTETQRRAALGYENALRKMSASLCPGCERTIVGGANATTNFCVHCGMKLFDNCTACTTRKNAFFQYCPTCGVPGDHHEHPPVSAPPPAAPSA